MALVTFSTYEKAGKVLRAIRRIITFSTYEKAGKVLRAIRRNITFSTYGRAAIEVLRAAEGTSPFPPMEKQARGVVRH